jgi:hypothetical protein
VKMVDTALLIGYNIGSNFNRDAETVARVRQPAPEGAQGLSKCKQLGIPKFTARDMLFVSRAVFV